MDIHRQPDFSNEPASQCRSLGSNCRPCSQPRKISRGIMIGSPAKFRSKNLNKKEAGLPTEECGTLSKAKSAEDDGNRVGAVNPTNSGKQSQAPAQETSPWFSTRSIHQKIPISEAVHGTETTPALLATTETHDTTCVPKEALETHSVHCFENRMPVLGRNESSQRRSDGEIYDRKDGTADGKEKLSYATAQEVMVEDKTKKAKTRGSETLRMKLWEILGTVSSPNKEHPNDYDLKVGGKDLESLQKNNVECNTVFKSKQNSDTIESDSEYPNHTLGRPMTRSVSQRGASNKLEATTKKAPATYCNKEIEGKNAFSSREGFSARLSYASSGDSSMLTRKNGEIQVSTIEARKTCPLEQKNHGEIQEVRTQREIMPPGVKSLSQGNEGGENKRFHLMRENKFVEPKSVVLEKDSHQSPVIKTTENLRDVIDNPKIQENVDQQEDVGYSFLKRALEEKFDAQSFTFEMNTDKTPTKRSSPGFPPIVMKTHIGSSYPDSPLKTELGEQGHGPAEMIFSTMGIRCFKSFLASKSFCPQSNYPLNSSDDAGELEYTPTMKSRPVVEEEPENRMSKSSSENSDSETYGEGSHIKGCEEPEFSFPKINIAEKEAFMSHLLKKQRYHDGFKTTRTSPPFASPKVHSMTEVEHNSKSLKHLELNQEDGLARAVALFALALERVKSKMKSVARKRSADVLMSVAERIHMRLQKAESQIQADLGQLTSHSKSKRKRIELRCQELQRELNDIHERFKEDVKQHLRDCRSIVEGLEAHQMEVKVTVEKQRASHRKLLFQAEEEIESELVDAQRGIITIQNSARGKMLQLKNIVADGLKEAQDGEVRIGNF